MAGEVRSMIEKLEKVRGEMAVFRGKLAKAEEAERNLLVQILDGCTAEKEDGSPIVTSYETAMAIGQCDVAIVAIGEEWWELPRERRHEAIDVRFVPCAPQGL